MVTKSKKSSIAKRGRVKVGKLKLNKETVKDLTGKEKKQIKAGVRNEILSLPVICCRTFPEFTCGG